MRRKPKKQPATDALPLRVKAIDLSTYPEPYAMIVTGNCLTPFVEDGATLVFSKTEKPEVGDLVALYLRPDLLRPGDMPVVVVKRLTRGISHFCKFPYVPQGGDECVPVIMCAATNPRTSFCIPADKLMAVHKCIGTQREDGRIQRMTTTKVQMTPVLTMQGRSFRDPP